MRETLPLSTLPAFDAAARHQSFALAAEELKLSQAAISRQIKHLENRLGVVLFERRHRSVSLTSNGEQLYRTASVALRLIAETVKNFRPERQTQSINIATDLAFAHFWLIPRLEHFQDASNGISISVTASDIEGDCLTSSVDLPVLYGDGNWSGYDSRFLMDEEIFPVCSKEYLDKLGSVTEPIDLLKGKLLHVVGGPTTWVTWHEWLANHHVDIPPNNPGIELNSLPWTIQLASAGQGLALGWKYLCDDLLASGTLVRPITHSLRTDRSYYMLFKQDTPMREDFDRIYDWMTNLISGEIPKTEDN